MRRSAPFFVALGAVSYGIPGSLFEMSKARGVSDGELLCITFLLAFIFFFLVDSMVRRSFKVDVARKNRVALVLAGSTMGFTNTFYILSLSYVSVAVTAVMMMQSVWLSIVFAAIIHKRRPTALQCCSVVLILLGTVLATELLPLRASVSAVGMGLSLLSAVAYALTIQFTGDLGSDLPFLTRSRFMALGAFGTVLLIWGHTLFQPNNVVLAFKWGGITSVFALILPLVCFSIFMPMLPLGVGPILSAIELPSSIVAAYFLLSQQITIMQISGVCLILVAIAMANAPSLVHSRESVTQI